MRLALLLAILALPILEIALLIKVGKALGVLGVLAIVIGTAILGVMAIRRNGFTMARKMAQAVESGRPPGAAVFEGALMALAGGLLVAPGLITDTIGAILLIPPVRTLVAKWAAGHLFMDIVVGDKGMSQPKARNPGYGQDGVVIDGEFERLDEHTMPPGRPDNRPPSR